MRSKYANMAFLSLFLLVIGVGSIGGGIWLAAGQEFAGTGRQVGFGMLLALGVPFVLSGLGTGLAASVTYLVKGRG